MTQGYAQIQSIRRGRVTWQSEGGEWREAKIGLRFKPGDRIRTDGSAVLDLFTEKNGPVLRLRPGSQLHLDRLAFRTEKSGWIIESLITLEKGRVTAAIPKLHKDSVYRIVTPYRVVDLRSGQFEISAEGPRRPEDWRFPARAF